MSCVESEDAKFASAKVQKCDTEVLGFFTVEMRRFFVEAVRRSRTVCELSNSGVGREREKFWDEGGRCPLRYLCFHLECAGSKKIRHL